MPLTTAELVAYLEEIEQLGQPPEYPWPSAVPEEYDIYAVDWEELFGARHNEARFQYVDDDDLERRVGEALDAGPPVGPTAEEVAGRRPEVCAWYQPIHFHGLDWGIYILEDCLLQIGADIARFVPRNARTMWGLVPEVLRMAFATLFLHEAYHHKTESLAIRLTVAERNPCYRDYWSRVYVPALGGAGPLEEALANADSWRRLREAAYRRFVSDAVFRATRAYLEWRFPFDPPGYREAPHFLTEPRFEAGQDRLKSQVQERTPKPYRSPREWRLVPNINESLFGLRSDIWLIVRRGRGPRIPTQPLYRPVSARALESALVREFDYARVPGGKGSHVKLKSDEGPTIILPGTRKDLSPPVLRSVAGALGFRDVGELLGRLEL